MICSQKRNDPGILATPVCAGTGGSFLRRLPFSVWTQLEKDERKKYAGQDDSKRHRAYGGRNRVP